MLLFFKKEDFLSQSNSSFQVDRIVEFMSNRADLRLALLLHATCFFAVSGTAWAGQFTFTSLDVPGQSSSVVLGLNDRDEVVGTAATNGVSTNFAWAQGVFSQAPTATDGNDIGELTAISNRGWTVGAQSVTNYQDGAYSWRFGSATSQPLKEPRNWNVRPTGINSGNTVIGVALRTVNNNVHSTGYVAHGTKIDLVAPPNSEEGAWLTAINDAGLIAGGHGGGPGTGFTYSNGVYSDVLPPGAVHSIIGFVSPAGVVGGYYIVKAFTEFGFTWDGSNYTTYLPPGTSSSSVIGVGPQGQVVGTSGRNEGPSFVFYNGKYYAINFPAAMAPNGVRSTMISAINARGTIVGTYFDEQYTLHAFIATCPPRHAPCTR